MHKICTLKMALLMRDLSWRQMNREVYHVQEIKDVNVIKIGLWINTKQSKILEGFLAKIKSLLLNLYGNKKYLE